LVEVDPLAVVVDRSVEAVAVLLEGAAAEAAAAAAEAATIPVSAARVGSLRWLAHA
jgi:hypothetical protein